MKITNLEIFGMTCPGCANTVKVILEQFPGVERVDIELIPPEAKVLHSDDLLPYYFIKYLEKNTHYKAVVKIHSK